MERHNLQDWHRRAYRDSLDGLSGWWFSVPQGRLSGGRLGGDNSNLSRRLRYVQGASHPLIPLARPLYTLLHNIQNFILNLLYNTSLISSCNYGHK